ncbi:MAG: orotidine-5'-phosphate decarboxylase [Candidatus Bathyarchaeia archaeon]
MFSDWIYTVSRRKKSRLVLALDLESTGSSRLLRRAKDLIGSLEQEICAVKVNQHLILPLGLFDGVRSIVNVSHSVDIPTIADCKIADIGNTNRIIAENYFRCGFDAVTASPFVGWKEGLDDVFKLRGRRGNGVLLVVYLSSKGAKHAYEREIVNRSGSMMRQYEMFARMASEREADGVVVGATRPETIRRVNDILKSKIPIYSPGVGVQGGKPNSAVKSGATYLIVGRTIVTAARPLEAARSLRKAAGWSS